MDCRFRYWLIVKLSLQCTMLKGKWPHVSFETPHLPPTPRISAAWLAAVLAIPLLRGAPSQFTQVLWNMFILHWSFFLWYSGRGGEKKQQKKGSDSSRKTHSKNIRKNRKNIAQDAWDVQAHKCHKSMPKQICLIFRDQSNISTGEKHWILLQAWGSREDKWQEGRPVTMTTFPFLVPDNRDDSCQHRPYSHCLHFLFLRRALHQQSYTAM